MYLKVVSPKDTEFRVFLRFLSTPSSGSEADGGFEKDLDPRGEPQGPAPCELSPFGLEGLGGGG